MTRLTRFSVFRPAQRADAPTRATASQTPRSPAGGRRERSRLQPRGSRAPWHQRPGARSPGRPPGGVRSIRLAADEIEGDKRLVITMIDARQVAELNFAQLRDRSEEAALTRFDAEPRKAPYEPRTIVGTYLTDRDARSVKFETGLDTTGRSSEVPRHRAPYGQTSRGGRRRPGSRAHGPRQPTSLGSEPPVRWKCNTSPGGELERNFGAEHKTGRRHGVST